MQERQRAIIQITTTGMFVNIGLAAFKMLAGVLGNSQAVIADGVHSLSDIVTDIGVLVGVRYWSQPADQNHPYGHGRIEMLVTLSLALVLTAVAIGLLTTSLMSLRQQHLGKPGWVALTAALASIVVKEVLYQWSVRQGRRLKSSAVIANAWHHRSDAFSSIPAAVAVAGARIGPGWEFLDHLGSVVVCLFILQAAWKIGAGAVQQLIDRGASAKDIAEIKNLTRQIQGVREVHAVRTRNLGSGWSVDLHILVDGDLSVREGHHIAELAKARLLEHGPNVVDAVMHIEPAELTRQE